MIKSGLIVKSISGEYTIFDDNKYIVCKPRGIFRLNEDSVKVGDYVTYDDVTKIITKTEKRKNNLIRPVICNVDKAFVVTSVIEPDLNLNLLDKIVANLEYNNIRPILVFTKIDLLDNKDKYNDILNYYQKIGYQVYLSTDDDIANKIKNEINDNICVLIGQSGVGKSTLVNKLDSNLKLRTDNISKALGRGKHTTRHIELFRIGTGFLADSPGFGNIEFNEIDNITLAQSFVEFFDASNNCKYKGCLHINEPNCEVKKLVNENIILQSRYQNYLQFSMELKKNKKY